MAIGESVEERNQRIRPYIDTARKKLGELGIPYIEKKQWGTFCSRPLLRLLAHYGEIHK